MTEEITAGIAAPSESVPEESDVAAAGGVRYSAEVWAEIEVHYEAGTMAVQEISETYGPSPKAIKKHCDRGGIVRNSKKDAFKRRAEEKIMGAATVAQSSLAVQFDQQRPARIAETKETIYRGQRSNRARVFMIQKEIQEGTRTPAACAQDLKSLRMIAQILTLDKINTLSVLGADELHGDEKLPELIIRDLSKEEIATMVNADTDSEFDLDLPAAPVSLTEDEDDVVIEEGVPSPST